MGSIPGQGTKLRPHTLHGAAKNKNKSLPSSEGADTHTDLLSGVPRFTVTERNDNYTT